MEIISHRGYWKKPAEKNSVVAFKRSFRNFFGIETDVRDSLGELVISHDMALGSEISLSTLLAMTGSVEPLLALNIKADGLAKLISQKMAAYPRDKWFVFDMSVPDTREHLLEGNPVFVRLSEVEKSPAFFDLSDGVWLDSFFSEWFESEFIANILRDGKRVCIVSSELHGRDPHKLWEKLLPLCNTDGLILCTDHPVQVSEIFAKELRS